MAKTDDPDKYQQNTELLLLVLGDPSEKIDSSERTDPSERTEHIKCFYHPMLPGL